jgi:hypothetical protein
MTKMPEPLINYQTACRIAGEYGTPVYVYDAERMLAKADATLAFPAPFGLTVRYAMKAAPTRAILPPLRRQGPAFRRQQRVSRSSACFAAGIDGGLHFPQHAGTAAGISPNTCPQGHLRQCVLAEASWIATDRPFPARKSGCASIPASGSGWHQPHECRRPGLQFRHLA